MADQVSDAVLDEILASDPMGRVACETLITTGLVVVAGEISTSTYVDIPSVVRRTILEIGYDRAKYGFDGATCGVTVAIDEQSPDIAQGVDNAFEARAGEADPLDPQWAGALSAAGWQDAGDRRVRGGAAGAVGHGGGVHPARP
jgi:S-adenosylmethionine synthetase